MTRKLIKYCFLAMSCTMIFCYGSKAFAQEFTLDLDTAVQMALESNPKTKIADGNLKNAYGMKKQTMGQFGPHITFNHNSSRGHNYKSSVVNYVVENFSNSASVSLPIFTGGKRRGSIAASKRNYEIAELEIERTDQEVKLDTTQAYFNVLQTRNLVKLNKESVNRLEEHLKNVELQFFVGIVAKVDMLRSQVELADAQQELIKAENNYEMAVATLNNIVGISHNTETIVNDELSYNEYSKSMEDCIAFSAEHKPEIIQAEKMVAAAKSNVMSARSGYYPSVNVQGSYGWDKDKFPGDNKSSWQVAAVLSINVFDSNTTRGAVDAAQGTLVQREANYQQTKDNIFLSVRNSYLSLREAEKRIYTAFVAVEKAQEDYNIAQVRYQAGVGTNTDLLDAQVALTKAETNYVKALYDYNTSWANLENAMGVPVYPNEQFVAQ